MLFNMNYSEAQEVLHKKISYLEWGKAYARQSESGIEISSEALTGLSTEKNKEEYPLSCKAKVAPFKIKLIQLEDETYRVVDFPETISVTRVE